MIESLQMTRRLCGIIALLPQALWLDGNQRRTQKGIGRNGKTVRRCTGKTPCNKRAPGAIVTNDIERFFFILSDVR